MIETGEPGKSLRPSFKFCISQSFLPFRKYSENFIYKKFRTINEKIRWTRTLPGYEAKHPTRKFETVFQFHSLVAIKLEP